MQQLGGDDDRRVLIEGADKLMPRYSPSGHVIYAQAGNLMALPFDLTLLEMPEKAVPTPVMSGIQQIGAAPLFALSTAGSLVYVPGEFEENRFMLVQVGRDGKEQRTFGAPPRSYYQPRLSPDGRRVALDVFEGGVQVWCTICCAIGSTRSPTGTNATIDTVCGHRIRHGSSISQARTARDRSSLGLRKEGNRRS